MPLLDTAFAFSLIMLLVASTVSAIVSALHSLRDVRSEVLNKMLKSFLSNEVMPVLSKTLDGLSDKIDAQAAGLIMEAARKLSPDDCSTSGDIKEMVAVTKQEVIQGISQTDFGKQLQKQLGDESEVILNDLGKRFDQIGKKFTEAFRDNARFWTTVIAVAMALVLNIDSIFILDAFLTNADLRAAVIAQPESIKTVTAPSNAEPVKTTDVNGAANEPVDKGKGSPTPRPASDNLEKSVERLDLQMKLIRNAALPIGWNHFPYSYWSQNGKSKEDQVLFELEWSSRASTAGVFRWLAGILLTAFLAGLGAPFWYDVVAAAGRLIGRGKNASADQNAAS
jgi:hypothetical protein